MRISKAHEDLIRLYPWLDEAARSHGVPDAMLYGMHVALEEAVMNVAMHAFPADDPGDIDVRLCVSTDVATLVIEDAGRAFDPTRAMAHTGPDSLEEATPGGMGLRLMHHYCKDMFYQRTGTGNRLTLRFRIDCRAATDRDDFGRRRSGHGRRLR